MPQRPGTDSVELDWQPGDTETDRNRAEGSPTPVNQSIYRTIWSLCLGLLVFTFAAATACAAGVSISGTYEIVEKTDLGAQVKLVVRFHLSNHEQAAMTLQGVQLSDFSYPSVKAQFGAPVTLRTGASQDVSQEFVIPHTQFDAWRRGLRPRVVLELQSAAGGKVSQVVRLERVPARKGN